MLPVYLLLFSVVLCVKLIYYKENIMIPIGSYHSALVQLTRHNSELISAEISISNTVRNSLPTISNYMDYFPNLNQQDQACYLQAITRQSYLFPCPFVTTGNSFVRQNQINQIRQMRNLPIQQINKVSYKALIDNTQFPFPEGAIPYNALHLDTATYITVATSSSSYRMTKLFFFINVTALIIFLVVVATLLVKNHFLLKKMRSTQDKPVEESDTSFQEDYSRDSSLLSSKATLIKRNEFAETEVFMTESFSIEAFVFILILVVYVLTAQFVEVRKIPYLHESGVAIIMGFLAALFVRYTLETEIQFDNEIFFTIILPPIIFSAGYSLRKSLFFQHFGMITFLGIIGTILCFICLTLVLQIADSWIFHALTLKQIMLLSSVLCATDTVAAMSLIKPEKYPVLNAVLFGEGIINDAVAIILFRTVLKLQLEEDGGIDFNIVFVMIFDFLVLFIFSLAIGASFGFGLSYLLKINQSFNRHPIKETSLILLVGYMAYLIGELLGFSGIITLFTCSVIMGHYTFMNISEESQRGTGLAFETVSYIAEAFVYAYLGASVFGLKGEGLAVVFAIFIMIFLPLIRALMVYLLPWIYKCKSWDFPLNDKQLKVCWYSGLVRGVIAFALCLQIETDHNDYIVTIVLVIVMLTTLVGASMLKTFAAYIKLEAASEAEVYTDAIKSNLAKSLLEDSIYKPIDFNLESGAEEVIEHENAEKGGIKQKLDEFQNNYVVPLFKRPRPELTYEIEISTIQKKKPPFQQRSVL